MTDNSSVNPREPGPGDPVVRRSGWDGRVPGAGPGPVGRYRGPRRLTASLGTIAGRMGISGGHVALSTIFSRWEEVVGEAVAAHCTPLRLRGGVLVVEVDHPTWATELKFLSPHLVEKLCSITGMGTVASLDIRVARRGYSDIRVARRGSFRGSK